MPGLGAIPWQLLAAAVVSASFAVANFAPRRTVPTAGLAGAIGWGVFVTVDWLRLPPALASGGAAVVVGVGAFVIAHRQRVPTLVHVAAGIIPLLPGLAIYRGLRHLAEGDLIGGVSLLGQAVSTGLALAAGAILGELLAQAAGRTDTRLVRRLAGLRPAGAPRWRRRPAEAERAVR
jgi:uncharacterized membrane protein YjjB (DUF3815 family)